VIVVSDTSPIINLAAVGEMGLFQRLYGTIVIPQAVYDEVVIAGHGQPGATEVATSAWIETRAVADASAVSRLRGSLDVGEADAIALAAELAAGLLLMDERKGRAAAAALEIPAIGLLGVLVAAKRAGQLPTVRPVLDALRTTAGFWVSDALRARVLAAVGE